MNDKNDIIYELKNTIKKLKIEIINKQQELDSLLEQYQELSGIEFEDNEETKID